MGLKTILVCLTTPEHAATLLKFAVPLARQHNAHLIGLHTIEALLVYPSIAMHVPEPAFAAFNASQREESDAIKTIFDSHTENEALMSGFRLVNAEAQSAAERMIESARSADLVIMTHEDKNTDRLDQRHTQAQVIRQSGRPVVVVPHNYEGPEIGKNIVLGWSDTREASRAAHDLLSVANEGAEVTILQIGRADMDPLRDSNAIDLGEKFSRHGLKPTLMYRETLGSSIAEMLGTVAFEQGADLVVTGAFGHSRAYDFVIGATTTELLQGLSVPVMFSK